VLLGVDPYDPQGILRRTNNDQLSELVQHLAIENSVPIHAIESDDQGYSYMHHPFNLATGNPEEVFNRLYPPVKGYWRPGREELRLTLRDEFVHRATELFDDEDRRIGLAALGSYLSYRGDFDSRGIVPVNGLFADNHFEFFGYINGSPSRASRDKVELAATDDALRRWLASQERRLRDIGTFTDSIQLEHAYILHRAFGKLAQDHAVGLSGQGILRIGEIAAWATRRDELFLADGAPLIWSGRPPRVAHYPTGTEVNLEDNWIMVGTPFIGAVFANRFPIVRNRDPDFTFARHHRDLTWQKQWWMSSGAIEGDLLRGICQAWSCEIGDILAPVAERRWNDLVDLGDPTLEKVFGYRLRRPR
jgi:hypothetical protein